MSGAGRRADAVASLGVTRFDAGVGSRAPDTVAVEQPLEIRVAGEAVATTMRTPGDDRALALGYLLSEGSIRGVSDVGAVAHCGRPTAPDFGNIIEVTPAPGVTLEHDPLTRIRPHAAVSSACGVCGREQILALLERCASLAGLGPSLSPEAVIHCCESLAAEQSNFAQTGGMHAAAIMTRDGHAVSTAEDVGRHNAVDKAIGRLLLSSELPAHDRVLVVTSRASFEIVQKACVAGIPVVICMSAPTSLAIETATEFGMTLVGFVRGDAFNVYTGESRISGGH